jgi:PAS domain S-box-containing protein
MQNEGKTPLRFAELVDIHQLQILLELHFKITNVPVSILDTDQNRLVAAGLQNICMRFHRVHPVTLEHCQQSDAIIKSHLDEGRYIEYKCKNGLWDLAVPIFIAGEHTATLFIGQFFYEDDQPDIASFRKRAEEFEFHVEAYLEALRQVPVFSRERVRHLLEYYVSFVELLSTVGYNNLQLAQDIERRKRAEEVLHRYEVIISTISDPMSYVDRNYLYQAVNDAYTKYAKKSREDIIGHSVVEILGTERFERYIKPHIDRCFASQEVHYEAWFDVPDAELKCMDVGYYPVVNKDQAVVGVVVNLRDITERKRVEDLIRTQRDLGLELSTTGKLFEGLRLCVDAALHVSGMDCGGVYFVDETSGALDLIFHKGLSPGFIRSVSHYDADSANVKLVMLGNPIYTRHQELGVPLDKIELHEGLRAIAIVPLRYEDHVIGYLNIASHIFDEVPAFPRIALETIAAQIGSAIVRLKTEEALRVSEERFRTLVNSMEDIVFTLDTQQRHTGVYGRWLEKAGLTPEFFLGNTARDIFGSEHALVHAAANHRALAGEYVIYDWSSEGPSGKQDYQTSLSPLHDAEGNVVGIVGIGRDVTARKQAEAEIRKLNVELEQRVQQRTAELEAANRELQSFAYVVSHDLKAPLRGINQLAHWLVEEYAEAFDEKGKEMIDLLIGRVKRMDNLINGILQYSRIGAMKSKKPNIK